MQLNLFKGRPAYIASEQQPGSRQVNSPESAESFIEYLQAIPIFTRHNRLCCAALLRNHGGEPSKIVTDKYRSYRVAHWELFPETRHSSKQYESNWAEQSYEATRDRERGMRRFKSVGQAQRFITAYVAVSNRFNPGRQLVRDKHYRDLRGSAFDEWSRPVA
jgi:transposase-like protein